MFHLQFYLSLLWDTGIVDLVFVLGDFRKVQAQVIIGLLQKDIYRFYLFFSVYLFSYISLCRMIGKCLDR